MSEPALRGMILAAGYGTRLAPVTDHVPKPLLPVGGLPLLDTIIDRVLGAGCERAGVNAHHLGDQVAARVRGHHAAARLDVFTEPEILGTGGALHNARAFLAAAPAFLVHNGDVLCDADLAELVAAHLGTGVHTQPAGDALVLDDVPGVFANGNLVIAGFATAPGDLCVGDDLDERMPTGIHGLRPEDSYGAVHGWKGLVQLGHAAAQRRRLLHQGHLNACVGEVERRLDSGDSAADHQRPLGSHGLHHLLGFAELNIHSFNPSCSRRSR